jgi:hypothetical protein
MTDDLVDKARRSVFEQIGRNVCNLQKVEGLMKGLVILHSGAHGTANEVKARMRKLEKSLKKKSMGMVAKELLMHVFGVPDNVKGPDNPKEPWMSIKFSIGLEKDAAQALEQALSNVIEERNNLIHHDVAKYDLETIQGCRNFAGELEAQSERIKSMHSALNGLAKSNIEARKALAAYMETDEFQANFQGSQVEESEEPPPN